MMVDDSRNRRVALAAEALLTSMQTQMGLYPHPTINTISRRHHVMPSDDLIAGARQNGSMSHVRRFFCLFVTFDLFFTTLVWLICTMITGESLRTALEKQIVHYQLTTSLFDVVMAAACRFTVLLLFYALLHLNHRLIIALSTALTCAFLIAKVSIFDWSQSRQPTFDGFLIISSFSLAWGEAWFFDLRVVPQETVASDWFRASSMDPERTPLLRHALDDPMGRVENPGNFFTPIDSPEPSDDEDDATSEIGISAGSIDDSSSEFTPVMPRLTPELIDEYKIRATDLMNKSHELLTSNVWTLVKTTAQGDLIWSMKRSHGKIMKIEGEIDAPAAELIDCLYENVEAIPTWNEQVTEMRKIQTIDENTDIVYQSTKSHGGGIIGPRDFITLRHRGVHGSYHITSGVSIFCPSIPKRKNHVRGENGLVCFATEAIASDTDDEPIKSGKCRFTWILNTDLKGWLPRTLIDKSMSTALIEFMGFLRNHVRELNDVTISS